MKVNFGILVIIDKKQELINMIGCNKKNINYISTSVIPETQAHEITIIACLLFFLFHSKL